MKKNFTKHLRNIKLNYIFKSKGHSFIALNSSLMEHPNSPSIFMHYYGDIENFFSKLSNFKKQYLDAEK